MQWQQYLAIVELNLDVTSYRAEVDRSNSGKGRPRFVVSQQQLWVFAVPVIHMDRYSIITGCVTNNHLQTKRRIWNGRRSSYNLVQDVQQDLPYCGEVMFIGRLRSMGFFATRSCLRQALQETDPINRPLRWGGCIRPRQPYSVPGPNSLWHIGMAGVTETTKNLHVVCQVCNSYYSSACSACFLSEMNQDRHYDSKPWECCSACIQYTRYNRWHT